MRNIRLVIQYDGSRYAGFQKLGSAHKGVLVEEKITEVLEKMTGEKVQLYSAAKLESGVHALQQIANFNTNTDKKEYEIKHYLNQYLPKDIAILHVDDVVERFQSNLNAKGFQFIYHIGIGEVENVFQRKYHYYSFHSLDIKKMREAAKWLEGKHDFKCFSANKKMKKSTERNIQKIEIHQEIDEITIRIKIDDCWPFLIRKIVGILYEIGLNQLTKEELIEIVERKEAGSSPYLAQAQGLFLEEVFLN